MDLFQDYLFVQRFIAHATDGIFDDREWEQMVQTFSRHSRRIQRDGEYVQHALDESAERYSDILTVGGPRAVVDEFRAAVGRLRDSLEPDARVSLADELWRLARVDGSVHDMERHFIQGIERAWEVTARAAPSTGSLLEDVLLMKWYLAEATDGEASREEVDLIRSEVTAEARLLGVHQADVFAATLGAQATYLEAATSGPDTLADAFRASAARLHANLGPEVLATIHRGLWRIASADGTIAGSERSELEALAETWLIAL